MTLHFSEIKKITEELNLILKNALINKIKKGFQKEIVLEMYKDGEHYYLILGLNPDLASIHIAPKENCVFFDADHFTMILRKYLSRTTLSQIRTVEGERIVFLEFKNGFKLAAHLFSRGANLFLLDHQEHILSSLNPFEAKEYHLPEHSEKQPVQELKESADSTYNETVSRKYWQAVQFTLKAFLLKKIQTKAKKTVKSLKEKIKNLNGDYQKCLKAEEYFLYGSLLLSYHSQNKQKGLAQIDCLDYEGNPKTIPLDPKKTVVENGKAYFEKSKKLRKAIPLLEKRILEAEEKLERFQEQLKASSDVSLEELRKSIKEEKHSKIHKILKKSRILVFENEKGFRILVGRSSEENDQIFRISRGKDIWFHTRDYPGSHVLIWVENQLPDEQTIQDAAQLSVLYSKLKKQGEGYVMFTPRKFLSKIAGMPSGQVNVSRHKSLWIKIEPERIDKLKKRDS